MVKYEDREFKISSKANKFIKTLPKAKREKDQGCRWLSD